MDRFAKSNNPGGLSLCILQNLQASVELQAILRQTQALRQILPAPTGPVKSTSLIHVPSRGQNASEGTNAGQHRRARARSNSNRGRFRVQLLWRKLPCVSRHGEKPLGVRRNRATPPRPL